MILIFALNVEADFVNAVDHMVDLWDVAIIQIADTIKKSVADNIITEILRQYFINHPQSIDKYTFLQNSAFTHWVKEKCSKMC